LIRFSVLQQKNVIVCKITRLIYLFTTETTTRMVHFTRKLKFLLFTAMLIFGATCYGQDTNDIAQQTPNPADSIDYYDMTLEQLKQLKGMGVSTELEKLINSLISVSSKKSLSTRETPGIVTLITEDDLKNWGCRDIMDALRMVPGLDFGMDVQGVVGLGSRGNWGHEGKILLLIDGQEMNDILWGTTQWGNHYPIENIKKIEVIRGPGSSIYGGFAELGVINIVTKSGEDLNGVSVSGIYGQLTDTYSRRNVNLSYGQKLNSGLDVSLNAFMGEGNRSASTFIDSYEDEYDMSKESRLDPQNLNLGIKYKGFSFRGIYDNYRCTTRDGYGTNTIYGYQNDFRSLNGEMKYVFQVNDRLTITPKLNFLQQLPWLYSGESTDEYDAYIRQATRSKANINAMYKINRKLTWTLGVEGFRDVATDLLEDSYFENDEKTISYSNYAIYTEGLFKHRLANITLGARYDKHNLYGSAFNPRVALTKKIKRTHFKLLYSHGFRAPAIENINYSEDQSIMPERMKIGEFEIGYQPIRDMIVTANVFWMNIQDAIIYGAYYDPLNPSLAIEAYHNGSQTGTYGLDLDVKFKKRWGYVSMNYSFYSANGLEIPDSYSVEDVPSAMLGFPQHKFNFASNFNITDKLSINPTISYLGRRYSYTLYDENEDEILETFDPSVYFNIFINYKDLLKGLTIGAGVYDIMNSVQMYLQPYNSLHGALPGSGREIFVKMSYNLPLSKKGNAKN
jgi:outer membrane receptor for ferrienterochelin and colicin